MILCPILLSSPSNINPITNNGIPGIIGRKSPATPNKRKTAESIFRKICIINDFFGRIILSDMIITLS